MSEPKYVCSVCGSDKVQLAVWINPNTDEVIEPIKAHDDEDPDFCEDCEASVRLASGPKSARLLALQRPSAALWWDQNIDPAELARPAEPLDAEELADIRRNVCPEVSLPALHWCASCAGVLAEE